VVSLFTYLAPTRLLSSPSSTRYHLGETTRESPSSTIHASGSSIEPTYNDAHLSRIFQSDTGRVDRSHNEPPRRGTSAYNESPVQVLPSNSQLVESFPAGFALPARDQVKDGSSPLIHVDRTRLPSQARTQVLLSQFIQHTLSAFPIYHVPTLKRLVHDVCFGEGKAKQADICVVFSEFTQIVEGDNDLV
jgi:hypothetical protein